MQNGAKFPQLFENFETFENFWFRAGLGSTRELRTRPVTFEPESSKEEAFWALKSRGLTKRARRSISGLDGRLEARRAVSFSKIFEKNLKIFENFGDFRDFSNFLKIFEKSEKIRNSLRNRVSEAPSRTGGYGPDSIRQDSP